MRRMRHRVAVLGMVSGMVLAMPTAAVAETDEPTKDGTDCLVQYVDEGGEAKETSVEPEGKEHGQFRCVGGQWTFTWAPFEPDDVILADEIQVDPAGTVTARYFTGPALNNDLTVAEIAGIIEATSGSTEVVIDRVIVAVDDGVERTAAEIEELLAGKDSTGVEVLKTVDWPDPEATTNGLLEDVGPDKSTVVYFSIWGAIKRAVAWVVDKIEDAGDWIAEHCYFHPGPDGRLFTCNW